MVIRRFVVVGGEKDALLNESGLLQHCRMVQTGNTPVYVVCDPLGGADGERQGTPFPMRPFMVYLTLSGSGESAEVNVHFNTGPLAILLLLSPAIVIAILIMFWSRGEVIQIQFSFFSLLAAVIVLASVGVAGKPAFLAFRWAFRCIYLLEQAQRRRRT